MNEMMSEDDTRIWIKKGERIKSLQAHPFALKAWTFIHHT